MRKPDRASMRSGSRRFGRSSTIRVCGMTSCCSRCCVRARRRFAPGRSSTACSRGSRGSEIVVEASYRDERDEQRLDAVLAVGRRIRLEDGALVDVLPTESIRSWDDVLTDDRIAARSRVREVGWRSLVIGRPSRPGASPMLSRLGRFFRPRNPSVPRIMRTSKSSHPSSRRTSNSVGRPSGSNSNSSTIR